MGKSPGREESDLLGKEYDVNRRWWAIILAIGGVLPGVLWATGGVGPRGAIETRDAYHREQPPLDRMKVAAPTAEDETILWEPVKRLEQPQRVDVTPLRPRRTRFTDPATRRPTLPHVPHPRTASNPPPPPPPSRSVSPPVPAARTQDTSEKSWPRAMAPDPSVAQPHVGTSHVGTFMEAPSQERLLTEGGRDWESGPPVSSTSGSGEETTAGPSPVTPHGDTGGGRKEGRLIPPRVLAASGLEYPSGAFRFEVRRQDLGTQFIIIGAEGIVELRALVLANGAVRDVQVVASSGSSVLDHAASEALRRWRFAPALRDGTPVDAYVTLTVRFVVR